MSLIDKFGRKQLMIIGSIGYIATLLGVAWAFATGAQGFSLIRFEILECLGAQVHIGFLLP